jgi:tRNA(Leu) C34 or U34 (ribose-2'-O)-methylase TrmL
MLRSPGAGLVPVAVFDDEHGHGRSLMGVPVVGGIEDIPAATALIYCEAASWANVTIYDNVFAAAGAIAYLPVAGVTNLVGALERLKAHGLWVVGADAAATESYDAGALVPPIVLVVGGEGRGLHRLVRERCDRVVRIPLRGRVASLNVSVASALLLYEVARRRDAEAPAAPR